MNIDLSLHYEPRRIISIVGPSRSGTTIIKYALGLHPELTALAGEEEPYYKLAHNGYPWHHSDAFHQVNNPELVRALIANEVYDYNTGYNRKWLQDNEIEEPPYVEPLSILNPTDTLLLKTPQNCYRRGVLEQLYPNARIDYICVRRDIRAIVNGLMDGWESEDFKAREMPQGWWRFDMPPGWSWDRPLVERCKHQAESALSYMDQDYKDAVVSWTYEAFCRDWKASVRIMLGLLGLRDTHMFLPDELPVLMATEEPGVERWRKKRPELESLCG